MDNPNGIRPLKIRLSSLAATQDRARRYNELLTLCERLVDASVGQPVCEAEEWLADAQNVAVKFGKHLISIRALADGSSDQFRRALHFIDYSSIKVLARAALETYLTFAYVFCDRDAEKRKYRYHTWMLGGVLDRQRHAPSQEQHKKQLDDEAITIRKLQAEICTSAQFVGHTGRQQRAILAGDWRCPTGWRGIAIEVGYADVYFDRAYAYLCSYSHSSYLSILQMGQATDPATQRELSNTILDICSLTMARFIWSYSSLFRKAQDVLNAHPVHRRLAGVWHFEAKDFHRVWK